MHELISYFLELQHEEVADGMCTRRNGAIAAAAQEIIKLGCRQQKRLFFVPAVCGMSVSDSRASRPEAAAGLWTVTGCTRVN